MSLVLWEQTNNIMHISNTMCTIYIHRHRQRCFDNIVHLELITINKIDLSYICIYVLFVRTLLTAMQVPHVSSVFRRRFSFYAVVLCVVWIGAEQWTTPPTKKTSKHRSNRRLASCFEEQYGWPATLLGVRSSVIEGEQTGAGVRELHHHPANVVPAGPVFVVHVV